jgi:hypothetical protein
MNRELSRLSEHFRCIALSELSLEKAAHAQESAIARFGPVRTQRLSSWQGAFDWLEPLRTFPRHYILADFGNWTLVLCDMIGENCLVDVLFHSKVTGCRAVGGVALSSERSFFFIEHGKVVREVECRCENRWTFRELGRPLAVERPEFYRRRKRSERLPESLVLQYVSSLTGVAFPLDFQSNPTRLVAFERSWAELQATPKEIPVENDLETSRRA